MKINWQLDISLKWVRIPLIPYISFTKIKPEVKNPVPKRGSWAILPVPEDADTLELPMDREILPMPAKPAKPTGKGTEHTKEREYDPDKRYRRGMGPMAGTEAYRTIHVRRDLIQWFRERSNKPLSLHQLRTMKKSPFNHKWEKCDLTCTHRVANDSVLRRVLRNARTAKEEKAGIPQVITFVKKKRGFTLDKDLYKSLLEENSLLNQWQPPTPRISEAAIRAADTVAAYIKENSEIRR